MKLIRWKKLCGQKWVECPPPEGYPENECDGRPLTPSPVTWTQNRTSYDHKEPPTADHQVSSEGGTHSEGVPGQRLLPNLCWVKAQTGWCHVQVRVVWTAKATWGGLHHWQSDCLQLCTWDKMTRAQSITPFMVLWKETLLVPEPEPDSEWAAICLSQLGTKMTAKKRTNTWGRILRFQLTLHLFRTIQTLEDKNCIKDTLNFVYLKWLFISYYW